MSLVLRQRRPAYNAKVLIDDNRPDRIQWENGRAVIYFTDGYSDHGSCIRCIEPPCMTFSREELDIDIFRSFPSDLDDSVCATGAVT